MKKLFLLAAATFGMLLSTSCNKEDDKSSSDKTIKSATVKGYVSAESGVLQFGKAILKVNSDSLKTITATDTAYSFDVKKFAAKDTLKLVLVRDASKVIPHDTSVVFGYSEEWSVVYNYTDGTSYTTIYSGKDVSRNEGDSTAVEKYFKRSPITVETFVFDEKGNFVPAK